MRWLSARRGNLWNSIYAPIVALSMTAEVHSNDLEPAGAEFLGPAEGGTARLKVDRAAVQKDDRPAVATNLKVQTNVGVLERWQ
jgi:hypothetical protein